jgi:hypothetical protein
LLLQLNLAIAHIGYGGYGDNWHMPVSQRLSTALKGLLDDSGNAY